MTWAGPDHPGDQAQVLVEIARLIDASGTKEKIKKSAEAIRVDGESRSWVARLPTGDSGGHTA